MSNLDFLSTPPIPKEDPGYVRRSMRPQRVRPIHVNRRLLMHRRYILQDPQLIHHSKYTMEDTPSRTVEVRSDMGCKDLGEKVPTVLVDGYGEKVDRLLDCEGVESVVGSRWLV